MKAPTLIDHVYRNTFRPHMPFRPLLRQKLMEARRFVLGDEMAEMVADIAHAAYVQKPEKRLETMHHVRSLARLPHRTTWIEWPEKPLAKRARDVYGSNLNPDLVPDKVGWLLMQHETVETAFRTVSFGIGSTLFGATNSNDIGFAPFFMTWRSDDDGPLPWHEHWASKHNREIRGSEMSEILTGLPGYKTTQMNLGEIDDLLILEGRGVEVRAIIEESIGMARYLLGLLATINDLPVEVREVKAAKGFVARGSYKRFLDHSTITLKVPSREYRMVAMRAVSHLRRRAHSVRGHWRRDWRKEEGRVWVREHQRGDASLGFVTHDYVVEAGK